MINFTRKIQFTRSLESSRSKGYFTKNKDCPAQVLLPCFSLSHLLLVLRLAITQSSASETVGSQPTV